MAKRKHLEESVVIFTSAVARQVNENGVIRQYYRNNFVIDNESGSISSPEKLTGQVGRVRFVMKGEEKPGGGTVTQDAWSLVGSGTIDELRLAATVKAQMSELKDLI